MNGDMDNGGEAQDSARILKILVDFIKAKRDMGFTQIVLRVPATGEEKTFELPPKRSGPSGPSLTPKQRDPR